jgi:hypothetical protein
VNESGDEQSKENECRGGAKLGQHTCSFMTLFDGKGMILYLCARIDLKLNLLACFSPSVPLRIVKAWSKPLSIFLSFFHSFVYEPITVEHWSAQLKTLKMRNGSFVEE